MRQGGWQQRLAINSCGVRGGEVVGEGTPEEVAAVEASWTGRYLAPMLERAEKAREAAE